MQTVRGEFCVCLRVHMRAAAILFSVIGRNAMVDIYKCLLPLFILRSFCQNLK